MVILAKKFLTKFIKIWNFIPNMIFGDRPLMIVAIFFISIDRFFKAFAFNRQDYEFNLIQEILKFNYKENYYIAFSLPIAGNILIALIVLIIIGLIFFYLYCANIGKKSNLIPLFLIILGASSNLYDRVRYGFVIDYLDLKYFTVFNLSDAMITVGVFLLLIIANKKETQQNIVYYILLCLGFSSS
ncbi:MAG: signal peptidase II [bacterium]|nr:signal peptidase II [bacterium]